jgi:hypothetical protein
MAGPTQPDEQAVDELSEAHDALEAAARAVLEATAIPAELASEPTDGTEETDETEPGDGLVHSALAELRAIAGTPEDADDA